MGNHAAPAIQMPGNYTSGNVSATTTVKQTTRGGGHGGSSVTSAMVTRQGKVAVNGALISSASDASYSDAYDRAVSARKRAKIRKALAGFR